MKTIPSFTLTVALGFIPLFFCDRTFAGSKEELSIALNAEFDTINPIVNTMMAGSMVDDAVLRPITKLTPAGRPEAVLIKEIPTFKNKKLTQFKDKTGTHLRAEIEFLPAAQWGDGQPLTCRDLEAAWKIGSNDLVATPNREDYKNIQSISIDSKNPKKCTLVLEKTQYNFYLNFPRPIPVHLEMPVFEANKGKLHGYEHNSLYVTNIANPGLYNGPYRVSELKFGSHVVLVPNEKFYGEKPYFKKIVLRFILNSSAIEANLLSGNVQMASSSGMSFDQALVFEKKVKNQNLPYEVQFVPGVMYSHIDVNLDDPILKDKDVRQALAYAFNRKEMAQAFFENRQPPAYHFSTPFDEWYTDNPKDISVYAFNRAKAAELFDQAGWKLGEKGYRWKNGQKLSFIMAGVSDNKLNEMLSVYLQNQWKQVGVDLQLKTYPARVFFSEILRHRKFQLALLTWVNSPNVVDINSLSSSMIPSESNGWSGHNRAGWKNKEVDAWLIQAASEFDSAKRIALMRKVLRVYTDELPSLPAYYRSNNTILPKGLKGYEMSGHNFSEFLQIEKWHF
ncbi:peptide ABC transporter substrate-binding protein [Bdellovibrio svalbardensis]|uniref:Peptide ABC transporter substrate-binding protein n=1 Tax=Bdellovibrio svalbardensis TaxID=2972972 RepID=A0ABT6DNW0_9BACT|nr:peptide ABC transporter substrate-binding protein [Bdellovibrio svalbardensis]MDG0818177.1 peptide ABC transporter substrate-binding protein [Bdellovibrio svalbardensis]